MQWRKKRDFCGKPAKTAPAVKTAGAVSVSKKPRRVRRPQAANQVKSCSAAACTWQNILLALQVWNLSACGRQNLGPPRKPSKAVCVGKGDARERVKVSPSGGTGAERTLRRRPAGCSLVEKVAAPLFRQSHSPRCQNSGGCGIRPPCDGPERRRSSAQAYTRHRRSRGWSRC